CLQYNTVPFTF
nr:immunoglobulin light chain junction region [Macaca mulatta]MOW64993.1 immunoglobulin light chain junction region [Macaca mulatta]